MTAKDYAKVLERTEIYNPEAYAAGYRDGAEGRRPRASLDEGWTKVDYRLGFEHGRDGATPLYPTQDDSNPPPRA